MASDEYITTLGVVIQEQEYRETSKIISVYTEELGLVKLFAHGSNHIKSDLFLASKKHGISQFKLSQNGNWLNIKSAKLVDSNNEISNNVEKFFIAEIICEIVEKSTIEYYKNKNIYLLLQSFYKVLKVINNVNYLMLGFIIKYLSFLGYKPRLDGYDKKKPIVFSYKDGSVINTSILDEDYGEPISTSDINDIYLLISTPFKDYDELNINNVNKIERIIIKFLYYTTEINKLKTIEIYKRLG